MIMREERNRAIRHYREITSPGLGPPAFIVRGDGTKFIDSTITFGSSPSKRVDFAHIPELNPGERGLVMRPSLRVLDGTVADEGQISPSDLRFAALFFDRIAVPTSNAFDTVIGRDADYLLKLGIVSRPQVRLSGNWEALDAYKSGFRAIFKELIVTGEGRWSLSRQPFMASLFEQEQLVPSLDFDVAAVIPVPSNEVPLDDVLEFKRLRINELRAFQGRLEEACQAIQAAPDKPLAEREQIDALNGAIKDHIKAYREWARPFRLTGISAKIGLSSFTGAVASYRLASSYDLPEEIGALVGVLGGAASSISVGVGWAGFRNTKTPYEYVTSYHSEVFGVRPG